MNKNAVFPWELKDLLTDAREIADELSGMRPDSEMLNRLVMLLDICLETTEEIIEEE